MNSIENKVYTLVRSIPKGKVCTYGQIAKALNLKTPRQVGYILHKNPNPQSIPCHRIVNAKGSVAKRFAFGGEKVQIKKLTDEGVLVCNNSVDLHKYLLKMEGQ